MLNKIIIIPEYYLQDYIKLQKIVGIFQKEAIISIMTPDIERKNYINSFKHILCLDFYDLDMLHFIHKKYRNKYIFFNEEMAIETWEFVHNIKDQVNTLVVHCEGGVSRSPAIGKIIGKKLNIKDIKVGCNVSGLYNEMVYNIMEVVYEKF